MIPPVALSSHAVGAPASTRSKSEVSADFDTFLKMMTTQMTNQDPLNPVNSSDFAVQLATFSSVEQQTKTNELLASLGTQFGVLGMAQLAGWVGQEARSAAPVYLAQDPIEISYQTEPLSDQAFVVVRNSNGDEVAREEVSLDGASYQWFGADRKGNPLPEGLYALSVESMREGEIVGEPGQVESFARILEAHGGAGGPKLVLEGGVTVAAAEVTALRKP